MADIVTISKFLSLILRHNPGEIGLTLDSQGWALIDDYLKKPTLTANESVVKCSTVLSQKTTRSGLRLATTGKEFEQARDIH